MSEKTVPKKETKRTLKQVLKQETDLAVHTYDYRLQDNTIDYAIVEVKTGVKIWLLEQKEAIEDIRCICPICNGIRAFNKVIDELVERLNCDSS